MGGVILYLFWTVIASISMKLVEVGKVANTMIELLGTSKIINGVLRLMEAFMGKVGEAN